MLEGCGFPIPERDSRQLPVLWNEFLNIAPASCVVISSVFIVPEADPLRPRIAFSGEQFVNMLHHETFVEGGEVLQVEATIFLGMTGELPCHLAGATAALGGRRPRTAPCGDG